MATTCWLFSVPTFSSVTGPVLSPSHLSSLECSSSSLKSAWVSPPCSLGVALEHLAVFLQLLAIEIDDFAGSVVGIIFRDHQLHAKGFGEKAEIERIAVLFVVPKARPGIERQSGFSGVRVGAHVQVADGALDVQMLILCCLAC